MGTNLFSFDSEEPKLKLTTSNRKLRRIGFPGFLDFHTKDESA